MKSKKHIGSYYTPEFLSKFIMEYVAPYFQGREKISILEPSVGNGSYIKAFNETTFPESIKKISFIAVEKIKPELQKAKNQARFTRKTNTKFSFVKNDFLHFQETLNRKFSFIAGNPPYIKKSLLNKTQIKLCNKIHADAGLQEASVKNIWPYFLIRNCQLLEDNGVLAFVLPAELLQVNFSAELRHYLITQFQRVEIFTFDDLLFECKGQDTILVIAYKEHQLPGQYYAHIANTKQLSARAFILTENPALKATETKWIHHLLSPDELTFIYNIADKLKTVDYYCVSKPGIVTAANKFFIINRETEELHKLSKFVKPIIEKGFFVNGSVVFDKKEFEQIVKEGKPSKVLCISDDEAASLPITVRNYLKIGLSLNLPDGYKCSKRENWFVIPNISFAPDGFFFRRIHHYPKLLKNSAKVLVTDTAYKIEMRNGYNINNLIYSFYNSLSLTFTELSGRYYGGGILEVTPREFKNLPMPNVEIAQNDFNQYNKIFEKKKDINAVLDTYDYKILNKALNLNSEEIQKIKIIYAKLVLKRFRKKV